MKKLILVALFVNFTHTIASTNYCDQKNDPIAKAMQNAIGKKEIPGGVVLITHQGETIYQKAFGKVSLKPYKTTAKEGSMYDLSSLTKLYTATLIMRLHQKRVLDVKKPVSFYIPSFRRLDKAAITIEQLLTHRSGLPAESKISHYSTDIEATIEHIAAVPLKAAPGEKFIYSDLGPIVAGFLAEQVTGKPLGMILKDYVLLPLNLYQTFMFPPPRFFEQIAPSNSADGKLLHGRVYDPRAYAMGGIAGNAGLFTVAADVAKFAQIFLQKGMFEGSQFLSEQSVAMMTTAPSDMPVNEKRGIGFDIDTKYSSPRGELFARTSFGHTGFTGTSVWIDSNSQTIVVLLTNYLHPDGKNCLHPDGKGNISSLRHEIGTLAAKIVQKPAALKAKK